jgi:hypothetical protein
VTGWDFAIGVGAVVVGLTVGSAILVAGLILADEVRYRRQQRRINARRTVPEDPFPFESAQQQAVLYARFWEIVCPPHDVNAPVVPGDGGEPRWTS